MTGFVIRRAAERAVTTTDWLDSAHSFAFGPHYDPDNLGFGPLVALNRDVVAPGPGYPAHRHAGLEILTWVLHGTLEHEGPDGLNRVPAGRLQYLSTGAGLNHAERSGSDREPVRVVQMWLTGPAEGPPLYRVSPVPDGPWVLAAGVDPEAAIRLRYPVGRLYRSVLPAGHTIALPAGGLHLFVVAGAVTVGAQPLAAEDALRGRAEQVSAVADAELLVWSFTDAC